LNHQKNNSKNEIQKFEKLEDLQKWIHAESKLFLQNSECLVDELIAFWNEIHGIVKEIVGDN